MRTPRPPSLDRPTTAECERLDARIRDYLERNPGSTARDVAVDLLHGSGEAHTRKRSQAATALRRLERAGLVMRLRDKGGRNSFDRWYLTADVIDAVESELQQMEREGLVECVDDGGAT